MRAREGARGHLHVYYMGTCTVSVRHTPRDRSRRSMPLACACMPAPPRPRAAGGLRACAAARGSESRGACVSRGCVRRRVRRTRGRAGGKWVRSGEHAATAEERAVLCAVLPCCPDSLARHEQRGCGQALGFRHTARRRLRRAGCEGVGSRGSLEPGAMEQRALRTPSPLLHISVGNVRWWGVVMAVGSAPERGDGGEGRALAAQHTRTVRVTLTAHAKWGRPHETQSLRRSQTVRQRAWQVSALAERGENVADWFCGLHPRRAEEAPVPHLCP